MSRNALKKSPNNVHLWIIRALSFAGIGNIYLAKRHYRRAKSLLKDLPGLSDAFMKRIDEWELQQAQDSFHSSHSAKIRNEVERSVRMFFLDRTLIFSDNPDIISVSERDFMDAYSPKMNHEIEFCWVCEEGKPTNVMITTKAMDSLGGGLNNSMCFNDDEEDGDVENDRRIAEDFSPFDCAVSADATSICVHITNLIRNELKDIPSTATVTMKRKKDCSLFSRFYWDILLLKFPWIADHVQFKEVLLALLSIVRIIGMLFSEAQILSLESLWLSAEIKYLTVFAFCESAKHLMTQCNEDELSESLFNGIEEYIRRVKCACCFNIAMCKLHRDKLLSIRMDKNGVHSWSSQMNIDEIGSFSALEFCNYGNQLCNSVMGKIKTSIILEALGRYNDAESVLLDADIMLHNQMIQQDNTMSFFVGEYELPRLFSQILLGWIKMPVNETVDNSDFYRCVQYFDSNIPDSTWKPYLQSRLRNINSMKLR
mmetsp:Transcript_32643/g.47100  ORF Transcript_32643/g.47100 Transcript_32643/m.47100 type:complete len:484 (-) Transcript_32643:11-1462(-)